MVKATITEKAVARKAFETEVREKRAGPAMIEQVAGNMFKTRFVFVFFFLILVCLFVCCLCSLFVCVYIYVCLFVS